MTKKILWTLAIISFLALLWVTHLFVEPLNYYDPFLLVVFIFSNLFILSLLSVLVTLLVALIPFRQRKYGKKLISILPVSIIGFSVLFSMSYVLGTGVKYSYIKVPQNLDCHCVKNGIFEIEGFIYERQGNVQIETNTRTKSKTQYNVKWLSNCEYELSAMDNPEKTLQVKIVEADSNHYVCYASSNNRMTIKYILKRVKNQE